MEEVRIRCLELAALIIKEESADNILELAEKIFQFITQNGRKAG